MQSYRYDLGIETSELSIKEGKYGNERRFKKINSNMQHTWS